MTFGTLGAMIAADGILGATNPWTELFDTGRTKIRGGAWDYLSENKDYPYYLIRDRFAGAEGRSLRAVKRGEGKMIDLTGQRVAVVPRRRRHHVAAIADLHAHGLRGGVEHGRAHVGLPVPRLALQAERRGDLRSGGVAAARSRTSDPLSPGKSTHGGAGSTTIQPLCNRNHSFRHAAERNSGDWGDESDPDKLCVGSSP